MEAGILTEEVFNTALGNALRRAMPEWAGDILIEKTRKLRGYPGRHSDILVVHRSIPPVAIESSVDRGNADKDAIDRLGLHYVGNDREIKTAIAVELRQEDLDMSEIPLDYGLRYALHQSGRRFPKTGFIEGDVLDLARLVATTAVPKEEMEKVASEVAGDVIAAANILMPAVRQKDLLSINKNLYQRSDLSGMRTTMVLWLNALFVQHRLYGGEHNIPRMTDVPSECSKAWHKIHDVNWRAIFEPAIKVLDGVRGVALQETSEALHLLIGAVEKIETARLGSEVNIGAELFPKVAEDRKQSAAFYTQASTAELLAALTIPYGMADWSDSIFDDFKMADITCGTGTLLRFGYRQVKEHCRRANPNPDYNTLHKAAMENGLVGTDVSPIAAHLTSTGLALDTKQPYGRTKIGWVGVGNLHRTGAIEYVATGTIQDFMMDTVGHSTGGGDNPDYNSITVKKESIDVILMNPPYTRTRGGLSAFDIAGLSGVEKAACQKRWGELIRDEPCVKTAGMAATFLCIAKKKVKPGGRIGFVLPRSAASDNSWERTRDMIERGFEDVMAIVVASGEALGRDALSADTMMDEMLLVATRRAKDGKDAAPVRCVTLLEPPSRLGESAEVARAIAASPMTGPVMLGDQIGVSTVFDGGGGAPWSSVGVMHDTLDSITNGMVSSKLIDLAGERVAYIPMTTVGRLFDVGPTHDLIGHPAGGDPRGAFTFNPVSGETDAVGKHRSLWETDAKTQTSMVVLPTHKGVEYRKAESKRMWRMRGTLFMQRNMRWTSQSVLVATTRHAVMGSSVWTGLLHKDPKIRKAFALWANSVFGMMVYWSQGNRAHTGRTRLQVKGIENMPCPDFASFDEDALGKAAAEFDRLCEKKLMPAWAADSDPVRAEINEAAATLLGAPDYDAAAMTNLWCAEPSVRSNKRPPKSGD